MNELGSSQRKRDGKNGQGKRAEEKHKTGGDATTEQTSPESDSIIRRTVHFIGKAVFYSTAVTAVVDSTIRPASAKGLSNNDRYALDKTDDRRYMTDKRKDHEPWHSEGERHHGLVPRRGSSRVDSLSRYTGRGHDEFSQLGRGDHGFVQPTQKDIRKLLENEDFPRYLNMICEQPQKFAKLLDNKAFLETIDPLYLDKGVLDFMQRLCNDPKRQEGFLKLAEQVRSDFKKQYLDTIHSRFGNDERHDKGRETDHPPIQKRQQNQEYESMPPRTMQRMQDTIDKMQELLYQKDKMYYETYKMRMEQDAKDKDRRFNSEERSRRIHEQEKYAHMIVGAGIAIGMGCLIAKCCRQDSEQQSSIADLVERAKREDGWMRQEQQQLKYRSDQHQIGYTEEMFDEIRSMDQQGPQYRATRRRQMIFGDADAVRQELQRSKYKQDDSQLASDEQNHQNIQQNKQFLLGSHREGEQQKIEYRSEDRVKIEEVEDEGASIEMEVTKPSKDRKKRYYSEIELRKITRRYVDILNNYDLLLNLFKNGEKKDIKQFIEILGSKSVLEAVLKLKKDKDKELILKNEQFKQSLLNGKRGLRYLADNPQALKQVKNYGGEEFKQQVLRVINEQKLKVGLE